MLLGGFTRREEGLHVVKRVYTVYMLLGGFTCC